MEKINTTNTLPTVHDIKAQAKARMIKKLFALGYHRHFDKVWIIEEADLSPSQRVAKHLNEWLTTHKESPVKKKFQDMTGRELQTSITVIEKIDRWQLAQMGKTPL